MRLHLRVLTPTLFGSGRTISPGDYVVAGGEFVFIDWERFTSSPSFPLERFLRAVGGGDQIGLDHIVGREVLGNSAVYRSRLDEDAREYLHRRSPDILAAARTAGRPYIPGSSIKGALRTALLAFAFGDKGRGRQVERQAVDAISQGRSRTFVFQAAERSIFGPNPNHDALRALKVWDSEPLSTDCLQVALVRVLNLVGTVEAPTLRWRARQGGSAASLRDAMTIAVEVLKPGTEAVCEAGIDDWLLARRDASLGPGAAGLERLKEALLRRGEAIIRAERRFFQEYDRPQAEASLAGVEEALSAGRPCLPMGWGSGWRAKSVGEMLPQALARTREAYKMGRAGMPFPKTRKVVTEGGVAKAPLGWVEVTW